MVMNFSQYFSSSTPIPHHDREDPPLPSSSYIPLPHGGETAGNDPATPPPKQALLRNILLCIFGLLMLGLVVAIAGKNGQVGNADVQTGSSSKSTYQNPIPSENLGSVSRGISAGVSEKANWEFLRSNSAPYFPWTNSMLSWQRTSFHFQPEKNWMNDPNGPLFYKGWYHFFYQYNPNGAVWGDIVWGHAVSIDLIHWLHLPLAMIADQWYDSDGVWSGSATILPDGQIVMLYTGSTNSAVQVQNLAYPEDPSDPLLINWVKYPGNPVLTPPPGIHFKDFRDPTTAWLTSEGKWRIIIGSKVNKTGIALVYDTKDFKTYQLLSGVLHGVPGTGMWECVDFFPVSKEGAIGLDTSVNGPQVKHVVKASLDDDRHDYYAIGDYDDKTGKWVPDDPTIDVGIGLRYDYGVFYASKTFYDHNKGRRILWGWIGESDSEFADIKKGWASVQSIPRTVGLDKKTGTHLLQWPVDEVESLRLSNNAFEKVEVKAGSIVPLHVGTATQLDILAEFEIDREVLKSMKSAENALGSIEFSCGNSKGAAERGAFGPFGLLVLADETLSEQTPVYFYIAQGNDSNFKTFFCTDQSRSSKATDVNKQIYGSLVPVLEGEKLSVRILVDHSIVESYSQGGRVCITSRVYPTKALYGAARVFVFNNATETSITASIKVWQMNSAFIHPYDENYHVNKRRRN